MEDYKKLIKITKALAKELNTDGEYDLFLHKLELLSSGVSLVSKMSASQLKKKKIPLVFNKDEVKNMYAFLLSVKYGEIEGGTKLVWPSQENFERRRCFMRLE